MGKDFRKHLIYPIQGNYNYWITGIISKRSPLVIGLQTQSFEGNEGILLANELVEVIAERNVCTKLKKNYLKWRPI